MSGAEVKFARQGGNANGADENTYANVTIMETRRTASPHQAGSKVTPERVAVVVLSLLLAAALIGLGFTYYRHIQTNESLQNELQALKRNLTETRGQERSCKPEQCTCPTVPTGESCLKCAPGWDQHGGKCYQFSAAALTWERSKEQCPYEGADLVKIDSREEQEFLELKLRDEMRTPYDRFWIGLTDSGEEGTWFWTDGSPLNNRLSFWNGLEPDNWKGQDDDGEDCVRMGEKAGAHDLKCWFDKSCKVPHRYICEKAAGTGRPQCVFVSS